MKRRRLNSAISTVTLGLSLLVPGLRAAASETATPESLAKAFVAALEANDSKGLESLNVSPAEFKKYVWPTISGAVAGGTMTPDRFYTMFAASNQAALKQDLAQYGGKKFEFVRVNTAPRKRYKSCRIFPNPEVIVKSDGGQEQTIRIGSALLERDGSFKVTSYYRAPAK